MKQWEMTMHNLTPAMLRVLKAREKVARRNVFFASILYTARLIETNATPYGLKTMFTNGIDIYFHPDFVKENDAFIEGVILHETLHCAFRHVTRKQFRKDQMWNIACDYAINPVVLSVYKLPKCALVNDRFSAMSAEKIYDYLDKQQVKVNPPPGNGQGKGEPQQGQGQPQQGQGNQPPKPGEDEQDQNGSGGSGNQEQKADRHDEEGPLGTLDEETGRMFEPTPEELEAADREWRRVLKIASERAERAGTMHAEMSRLVEELFPSEKLDWHKVLDDFARDFKSDDSTTWARPNRRFIGNGDYWPGKANDKISKLVVGIDCSGSMDDIAVNGIKAEAMNLLEQKIVDRVVLISTDTKVCNMAEVDQPEEIAAFDPKGGGGTDFDDAMREIAKIEDAIGCVFCTDMQTCSFGKDPGMPVIWVDWTGHGKQSVPFGRVTAYEAH
jgi:predicted metal-dependent peptidase